MSEDTPTKPGLSNVIRQAIAEGEALLAVAEERSRAAARAWATAPDGANQPSKLWKKVREVTATGQRWFIALDKFHAEAAAELGLETFAGSDGKYVIKW